MEWVYLRGDEGKGKEKVNEGDVEREREGASAGRWRGWASE